MSKIMEFFLDKLLYRNRSHSKKGTMLKILTLIILHVLCLATVIISQPALNEDALGIWKRVIGGVWVFELVIWDIVISPIGGKIMEKRMVQ